MSNNRTRNVTLPLKASLNMTRNTEVVSNTFDQLNSQNSPVFGGTIHPLHTLTVEHSEYGKYDKYGSRWAFGGGGLYKDNVLMADYNGSYYFQNDAHPDWPSYSEYDPNTGVGIRVSDGVVYCYLNHAHVSTHGFPDGYVVVTARIIRWSNNDTCVLALGINDNSDSPYRLAVFYYGDDLTLSLTDGFALINPAAGDGGEGNFIEFKGSQLTGSIGGGASTSEDQPFLSVSKPVNIDGISGYVISVLNRKFKGENVYGGNLQFRTAMVYFGNAMAHGVYVTYPGTSKPLALLGPSISTLTEWYYDGNNLSSNPHTISNNSPYNTGYIVADGTDMALLTGQYQENRDDLRWVFPFSFQLGNCSLQTWNGTTMGYITSGYYESSRMYCTTSMGGDARRFIKIDNDDVATLTVNQRHARMTHVGRSGIGTDSASSITNVTVDSMCPTSVFAMAGFQSTITPSTTVSTWADYHNASKYSPFPSMYNSQGAIAPIMKTGKEGADYTGWRLLFNYRQGYISGISYGALNDMGYLVTEWDIVDDECIVNASDDVVAYKDAKTGIMHTITRKPFDNNINLVNIVDNRYIFVPVNRWNNCYDIVEKKWQTWGLDWNDRVLAGYRPIWDTNGTIYNYATATKEFANSFYPTASMGSGVNVNYSVSKQFCPSRIIGYQTYNHVILGKETFFYAGGSWPIDYYSSSGTSSPVYRYTNTYGYGWNQQNRTAITGSAVGTTFPVPSSGTAYNNLPIASLEFINGYNGKFGVKIGNTAYNIVYDGVRPIILYNTTSMVNDADEFFIVQSQYYAVVNNYIAAISYSSSGAINGVEQIVDVTGMEFIGAFPSVAYFWSPANRSIFAFTGDADLQLFVQSNRISSITSHLYAPNNEWIYLATNDGMYVLTQMNVFRVPSYGSSNIHAFFATDKEYNIIELTDGREVRVALPRLSGYTTLPVELETEFFGPGDDKTAVIDTWYVRVWKGDEDINQDVVMKSWTLTNIVTENEHRTVTITPDMWDSRDNAYIRYQPRNQHVQGTSFYLKSPYPVSYIGFSITGDDTSQIGSINI